MTPPTRQARSARRITLRSLVIGTLLLLVVAAVTPAFVIFGAESDEPEKVDAVFVLGPATPTRMGLAQELVASHYADHLLVSVDAQGVEFSKRNIPLCSEDSSADDVTCREPWPQTTQGEVALANQIAQENGWDSLLVVTSSEHLARSRLYFDRCFQGSKVLFIGDSQQLTASEALEQYFYQSSAFAKAVFVTPDC